MKTNLKIYVVYSQQCYDWRCNAESFHATRQLAEECASRMGDEDKHTTYYVEERDLISSAEELAGLLTQMYEWDGDESNMQE